MNTTDNPEKPRIKIERSISVEDEIHNRFPEPEFDEELGEYKDDEFGVPYNEDGLPEEIPLITYIDILNSIVNKYGDTVCSVPKISASTHYASDICITFETLETDEEYAARLKKELASEAARVKREAERLKLKLEKEAQREKARIAEAKAKQKAKEAAEKRKAKRDEAKALAKAAVVAKPVAKKKASYTTRW